MQRLTTRAQFQAVMDGTTVARTAHFVLHRKALTPDMLASLFADSRPNPAPSEPWLGAMLPKRWAKRAVTRNALRRQIYTVAAEAEPSFGDKAHVVRLRQAFNRADFPSASSDALKSAVRTELQQLFAGLAP